MTCARAGGEPTAPDLRRRAALGEMAAARSRTTGGSPVGSAGDRGALVAVIRADRWGDVPGLLRRLPGRIPGSARRAG
ncbi:hypothetical protein ACFYON_06165 [Micromonospora sp. NPDC005686]|uniref:hypothetical protein n=1 Tax=unclassified Micromonospora TaxID=2617518 RepID=UPI0033BA6E06